MSHSEPAVEFASARAKRDRDIVALWVARMLALGGSERLIGKQGLTDDSIAELLGLAHLDPASGDAELRRLLKARLAELEAAKPLVPSPVRENIARFVEALGLSPTAHRLIEYFVLGESYEELREATKLTLRARRLADISVVAKCLGVAEPDVRRAIQDELVPSGIVRSYWENAGPRDPLERTVFELLPGLSQELFSEQPDIASIFKQYFREAVPATLTKADFSHLREDLDHLTALLRTASERREPGINVLLYGPPGTGKTQLARLLAREAGCRLLEVGSSNKGSRPLQSASRLASYSLCQQASRRQPGSIVLFDEVEDVFDATDDGLLKVRYLHQASKAWINRLLEENPVPALWITNDPARIDPAFRRRFAYLLEFRAPPRSVRTRIVAGLTSRFSPRPAWVDAVGHVADVTPAQIQQAARVTGLIEASLSFSSQEAEATMGRLIARQLRLQGASLTELRVLSEASLTYDPSLINCDVPSEALVAGLSRSGSGRVLMYGPPGTGKTAFAHHVADRLERPLLKKNASDLLSKWVGGTEKQIAEMFDEARRDEAVLLLDEADSFLRNRALAQRSWEITQVNELLVQMEQFDGIFVCATNFREATDIAALRRFDLKLEFRYLALEQRARLFAQTLACLHGQEALGPLDPLVIQRLRLLDNLTPGDFAAQARQARILGASLTAERLLDGLEEESRLKLDGRKKPMGFVV